MEKIVQIEVPSVILEIISEKNLKDELKLLIALELYREGSVSLGKASEIAGISIYEFMYELRKRRIPINYDEEELEEDLKTIEKLIK